MQEKQIMIPKTIFETSDGRQFDDKHEAEKWECQLYFNTNMTTRYREVEDIGLCVLNSTEEAKVLETLSIAGCIQKGFFAHSVERGVYLEKNCKFPMLVKFSSSPSVSTKLATEADYAWFKEMSEKFQTLCKMYESTIETQRQEVN